MLMWGDRLLEASAANMGKGWEASDKKTADAIDLIPKDIVICDWHYSAQEYYPSIDLFIEKGFRVWPSGWKEEKAGLRMVEYAKNDATGKVLGYLGTSWVITPGHFAQALLGEGAPEMLTDRALPAANTLKTCIKALAPPVTAQP